ncbi:nucleoside recognition domain-containing protein [Alicyclobacillus suci]|uniref:nucleoside recognition domain-containing protein n=1 Tax=Alicyclobacillus suci TaxID=2816080 RepID=UPI001A8EAF23|nr:nucleoside recognition domain-containing protein [Alicyclobacillus suci]
MLNAELTAVLVGMESAGKSTIFSKLTHYVTGEEVNFRGSTVVCRRAVIHGTNITIVDTPGIRHQSDSETTRMALREARQGDVIVFVIRGTHAAFELKMLSRELEDYRYRVAVILTFEDKTPISFCRAVEQFCQTYGVPFVSVDARAFEHRKHALIVQAVRSAKLLTRPLHEIFALDLANVDPPNTLLEHKTVGPWLALILTILLFGVPVVAAYLFASVTQSYLDTWILNPLRGFMQAEPYWLQVFSVGDYGLLTLGPYSFLWAFPVVVFIGISVAVTEEMGLKDRITDALDPWLQKVGLEGRDLIPVLTGFGCNVVGVLQSRACGQCTRRQCVSLISYGSACSYTIGATLSLFNSAGRPLLFLPYIFVVFIVGAVHTRIFNRKTIKLPDTPRKTFLQRPTWKGIGFRVRAIVKQFMLQAMPTFLLICMVAALLDELGIIPWASSLLSPVFMLFHLPGSVAPSVLFSMIRKDGMLVLNQHGILGELSIVQLFVVVYLASTLSACLVTLWTVAREFSWRFALQIAGKQAVTSIATSALLAWLVPFGKQMSLITGFMHLMS